MLSLIYLLREEKMVTFTLSFLIFFYFVLRTSVDYGGFYIAKFFFKELYLSQSLLLKRLSPEPFLYVNWLFQTSKEQISPTVFKHFTGKKFKKPSQVIFWFCLYDVCGSMLEKPWNSLNARQAIYWWPIALSLFHISLFWERLMLSCPNWP